MRVLDISGHQTKHGIDWEKAVMDPIRPDAVYVKLTEGQTYTSKWAEAGAVGAHGVGLPIGYYHFARPDTGQRDACDAKKEAMHYLKQVSEMSVHPSLAPVLDVERAEKWSGLTEWICTWASIVRDELCRSVMLYANPNYLEELDTSYSDLRCMSLWVSHFGVREPRIPSGLPWTTYDLHQYTSTYECDGFKYRVDVSRGCTCGY